MRKFLVLTMIIGLPWVSFGGPFDSEEVSIGEIAGAKDREALQSPSSLVEAVPSALKSDFNQDQTRKILDDAIADYRKSNWFGANIKAVKNHWSGGKLDFKVNSSGKTFDVPGRGIMSAPEFGNYITAYTTFARFGKFGEFGTRLGGHASQFLEKTFREVGLAGEDADSPDSWTDDPESKYLIQMGVIDAVARLKSEGKLPIATSIPKLGPRPAKLSPTIISPE